MIAPELDNAPRRLLREPIPIGHGNWLMRFLVGSGERRARLRTLALIRWVAIVGQAFTILLVDLSLEFDLPLAPLLLAVALSALINVYLELGFSASTRLTERAAFLLLTYDLLQLTFLLALTGGLQNPFSVLLIIPVTLSATILSLRTTVFLCIMVTACATLLGMLPSSLPWKDGGLTLPTLYIAGVWIALVLSSVLIAAYAWRVADEARRLAAALSATQMALAREQQMSALGGLAAAAAHELGSPLATIAVTAKELANSTPADSPMAEDIAELVSQSARCREILASLSKDRSADDHAAFTAVPLGSLLATLAESYRRQGITVTVEVEDLTDGARQEPSWAPTPELRHALGNLVDNAIQFAERSVLIRIRLHPDRLDIVIEDDGPGFSPEVLDLVGEPYISTRSAIGGLGLGVFIAQTLLARTGATLQFGNQSSGAQVIISWATQAVEQMRRRPDHE
ncbi:MAG: ActS/PrrB/RegB family redox-sensitive histidine kinase [Alphaproteobacteria bacterium]|nr:ActS/PrrB/RegB family redox-sensitive histidine kinase [Alphaproteobacteria bacterium]